MSLPQSWRKLPPGEMKEGKELFLIKCRALREFFRKKILRSGKTTTQSYSHIIQSYH